MKSCKKVPGVFFNNHIFVASIPPEDIIHLENDMSADIRAAIESSKTGKQAKIEAG